MMMKKIRIGELAQPADEAEDKIDGFQSDERDFHNENSRSLRLRRSTSMSKGLKSYKTKADMVVKRKKKKICIGFSK